MRLTGTAELPYTAVAGRMAGSWILASGCLLRKESTLVFETPGQHGLLRRAESAAAVFVADNGESELGRGLDHVTTVAALRRVLGHDQLLIFSLKKNAPHKRRPTLALVDHV